MDYKYIELEEENAKLQRDVKQLTDDNKLMWDLWKQVQMTKPDITQIIAITVDRESKKYAAKEKHIWGLMEERDSTIKRLEEQLEARDDELESLSMQIKEIKANDADLKARYVESAVIEEKLKDELDRLNKQLIDSDDVNNRLLVSMEKENTALKNEVENLKRELKESENQVVNLKSSCEAASNSSSTLWSELASYRQMISIMEAELNGLKDTCSELRKSLNDKQEELEGVLARNEKIADERNRQSYLVHDLELQVEALCARNRELEDGLRQNFATNSPHDKSNSTIMPSENLMIEISNLKEQLTRVTMAYEAKSLENEMLRKRNDDRLNAVERLHSEQRAILEGLDGMDQRLRKDKQDGGPADMAHELEASLETERLIALLKQHCRELANDRDVYASRVEKAQIQLANRESCIADLKLRLATSKRDREAEIRKMNAECERRLNENAKIQANKLTSEVSRQRNEISALEKKLEMTQSERRRLRSQLSACQARLAREAALSARQHDRLIELEQNALTSSTKLAATRTMMLEQQKEHDRINMRRRTRSASFCSQEDSPPRPKKFALTFDMAVQTDQTVLQILADQSPTPTVSVTRSQSKASRISSSTRQQLSVEKMRVARLLRLAADLKTDRMKLRRFLEDERQARQKLEIALTGIRNQLSGTSLVNKQLENKLTVTETDLARTRKALIDCEQRVAELSLISPRVDKSVITDQLDSCSTVDTAQVSIEAYEELKQRMAALLAAEREQTARLANFQLECDRLSSDLALTKERLNDARREQAKERRICEEQREKFQALEEQVSVDVTRIKELTERLSYAERTDKSVASRLTALKRRIEECESDKAIFQKNLSEKRAECERLLDQLKKAKTRCQYLEVMATAEKANCSRLETECKDGVKKMQVQLTQQNAQLGEFRRFIEMYLEMVIGRIRSDRQSVSCCEISESHKKTHQSSPSRGAPSRQSDASVVSRAASMAQTHLKLSASEAAELLMVGSVDASPPSSSLGLFDSPETFHRKVSNILRQIFSHENNSNEDATQFAHRLSDALFSGFADHIQFLITRPPCCLTVVSHRDDKVFINRFNVSQPQRGSHLNSRRQNVANSSTIGGLSDSVFSGSPY